MPIEKDIGGGGPKKVAEADPMTHMELELMQNLEGGFKEAIKNGFKGTFDEYLDTLSEDDLKTIFLAQGGIVKDPTFTKYSDGGPVSKSKEPKVKKINLADFYKPGQTVSGLSASDREKVSLLLRKMLKGQKDN